MTDKFVDNELRVPSMLGRKVAFFETFFTVLSYIFIMFFLQNIIFIRFLSIHTFMIFLV